MRFSLILSALSLVLSLLSLPSPSSCQNGTMRMTLVTLNAPFVIRQESGVASYPKPLTFTTINGQSATYPTGSIVLIGGEAQVLEVSQRSLNDVWATSDSGVTWALISGVSVAANGARTPSAQTTRTLWDGARSTDCMDSDGGLYLVAGSTRNPTNHTSNVTYSTDAVNWDSWGPQGFWRRQRSTCAVNARKQLFVLGGTTHQNNSATPTNSNDIWMSGEVGGRGGWQLVTKNSEWRARQGLNSDFYYSDYLGTEVLYVMNGYFSAQRLNDIWVSTTNGQSFKRLSPYANYQGRMDAQLTITKAGIMVVSAGDCGDDCNRNDVWASLDGGYTWGNCCDGPVGCYFTRREDHVQALDSQGRLLIISGSQQNPPGPDMNDIWRSSISFTNQAQVASACGLKIPAGGVVGLRCLPDGFCLTPPNGPGLKMNLVSMAPWAARFEGGIAVYPKPLRFTDIATGQPRTLALGALVMYGGRPGYANVVYNDVWATVDGLQWFLIGGIDPLTGTPSASTSNLIVDQARTADCYDSITGRIYVIGGTSAGNQRTNSVWTSSDAGMNWEQMPNGPFLPREAAACVVDSRSYVYLMGGTVGGRANDVWYSTNTGKSWMIRSATAPWEPRTQVDAESYRSVAMNVDLIYVANGIGDKPSSNGRINDVWVSSNGGVRWEMITAAAAYHGRQDAQLLATSTGALMVVAGDTGMTEPYGNVNDVWASLDGGYTWGLCNNTAGFTPREDQVTTVDNKGYLWVMQGEAPDAPFLNDVWKSQTPVSDSSLASLCKLKIPSCGVGLRCMPSTKTCTNHCPYVPEDESSSSGDAMPPAPSSSELSAGMIVLIVALVLGGLTAAFVAWKKFGQAKPLQGELGQGLTSTGMLGATEQYHALDHSQTQQL